MNIYPYVYRLDHPITGEFYIGYRSSNKVPAEQDLGIHYFTSSKYVKPRFHEFNYQIVAEFFDKDDAYDFEQELIYEYLNSDNILNKSCNFGKPKFKHDFPLSVQHKQKISDKLKGRSKPPMSDETKLKLSELNKGKSPSLETRQKISELMKGRTINWTDKISEARKGIKFSEEHKQKLRRPKSAEHKQKLREAKRPKKSTEERIAMSLRSKGIPKPMNVCRVYDRKEMYIANFVRWNNKQNLNDNS